MGRSFSDHREDDNAAVDGIGNLARYNVDAMPLPLQNPTKCQEESVSLQPMFIKTFRRFSPIEA